MAADRLSIMLLFLFLLCVQARSPLPPPIRRVHTPRSTLSIVPRNSFRTRSPHPGELRHDDTIHLTFSIPDSPSSAHLLLRPVDIFHPDAFVRVDGVPTERLRKEDYKLYSGDVIDERWINRAKAEEAAGIRSTQGVRGYGSVTIHHSGVNGIDPLAEGSFNIDGQTYHIKSIENYLRLRRPEEPLVEGSGMIIYRESDAEGVSSCSHDNQPHNSNLSHPIWQNRQSNLFTPEDDIFKRSDFGDGGLTPSGNYANSIGSRAGCPSSQQVVYMGVALDCNYVTTYNGGNTARTQILTVFNQVSALYRSTFNISLGITELVVQNATCPSSTPSDATWNVGCDANLSLDERLSRFSQWRGQRSGDGIGLWHLMSACRTDQEVGVAWLGTVCQTTSNRQSSSYVSGTGVSTALQSEFPLVAHEIGHGFGAIHDCYNGCTLSSSCCPASTSSCNSNGQYIMNPTTAAVESNFSPCTIGNVCSNIGTRSISTTCFQTPGGRQTISLQQCGNGIVDPGEDCDPGFNSTSPCCDPSTCKFRSGAVCDPTNSACCSSSCQFSANGTLCRPSVDDRCDYPEYCTGSAAACPRDQYQSDGTSCGSNGLACATGRCTSLDQQCTTAQGGSVNYTQACRQRGDTSCVITCVDPTRSGVCAVLQTPLIDGSPCGYGGRCYNQSCEAGAWQDTFQELYRQNLNIAIPVTVVVSLIILGILFAIARCIYRSCTGGGGRRKRQRGALPPPPMRNVPSNYRGPPPPPPVHPRSSNNSSEPINPGPQPEYGYGQNNNHNWAYNQQPQASGNGWVDSRQYNGPNFGPQQGQGYYR